ncbi:uncharacterized protein FIBRA_00989 [Fibroporia radiculosa]|uniref:FAM192A/Fyv6 N-terminal domain-containing protein n=1 Tax=Fibroporia radiculosa TaxID=599839 RepID=J4I887_9APHY|nr:uncharacterized protein FIBRA_00989 [Fibroporia radiculosa]CCL98981.1 predicted protein [Fibroporia radiculosa]
MDDIDAIPSISSGAVGSRFVSQSDIDTAKARREEQWKAAYARLGQEPPPPPTEDAFDGRSLAEKLAANRAAKQEEWEERNKLGNQFRALEEDEVLFLDSLMEKQREEERLRKEQDGEELKHFRKAVAARETEASKPPIASATAPSTAPTSKSKAPAAPPAKKDAKKLLKGVLVKKKPKPSAASPTAPAPKGNSKTSPELQPQSVHKEKSEARPSTDDEPRAKRRKISEADT